MNGILIAIGVFVFAIFPILLFRKFVARWGGISDAIDETPQTLVSFLRNPYNEMNQSTGKQDTSYIEKDKR